MGLKKKKIEFVFPGDSVWRHKNDDHESKQE